jgi:chromosomal replication initiator protein
MDDLTDTSARLSVPTRFLKSWIEAHYAERVLSVYRSEQPSLTNLSIVVRGALRETNGSAGKTSAIVRRIADTAMKPPADLPVTVEAQPRPTARCAGAPLDSRLTFDTFVVGRSNALAQAAADRIARHEGGTALYNPLYLQAGVGLGKTHLLHAIGNQAKLGGRRVIYLTADRFMYGFVASLKAQTPLAFKERLRGSTCSSSTTCSSSRASRSSRIRPHPQRPHRCGPPGGDRGGPSAVGSGEPRRAGALAPRGGLVVEVGAWTRPCAPRSSPPGSTP